MRFTPFVCALGLAISAALPAGITQAAEDNFLSRFEGSWSGSGTVSRKPGEKPTRVKCSMTGDASATTLSLNGKCGALIFSRNVGADIQFDPSSGRYSGTYVGSEIGPARVSGRRKGDAINLTITWPKPVRGDTEAVMTIHNPGNGQLSIVVTDKVAAGGPTEQVSNVALRKR